MGYDAMKIENAVRSLYLEVLRCIVGEGASERPGLIDTILASYAGNTVILSAPPGYGKTMISYTLGSLAIKAVEDFPPRCLHVLPMRSIIEDCYGRLFYDSDLPKIPFINKTTVARQMMGAAESPWLQKPLIFTTIDTYLLCAISFPPAEIRKIIYNKSLGHGLLSKSAILSSSTIFDEVHLFLEESSKLLGIFSTVIRWLHSMRCPLIIMSATLPEQVLKFLQNILSNAKILRYGHDFKDRNFENEKLKASAKIRTEIYKGDLRVLAEEASKRIDSVDKVLIITNTISRCIRVAELLKKKGYAPIVLHGHIVSCHRKDRLNALKKDAWVAVTTQVVEAGVDISAQSLISDAAPPCSLVQRSGRLLRKEEDIDKVDNAEFIITYDPSVLEYSHKSDNRYHVYDSKLVLASIDTIKSLKNKLTVRENIHWHLPLAQNGYGYEQFIERSYKQAKFEIKNPESYILSRIEDLLYSFTIDLDTMKILMKEAKGSFTRDQPLILGIVDNVGILTDNDKEFSYEDREIRQLYENWSLSLTLSDAIKLLTMYDAKILEWDFKGENLILKSCPYKDSEKLQEFLISKLIEQRLSSIVIPRQLYNDNYGLELRIID
ncbi:MAG: CRISPR-associated helicase Cas3' [Candidatus Baldrarchaeia archaeon]